MLYAITPIRELSGYVNDWVLETNLNACYKQITEIQANGDELVKCCEILGRELPKRSVYTFLGTNAQEIARNWDTK
jgi:hypothetical protein